MKLTRDEVAHVCSLSGVSLDPDWDGVSEAVPVLIPLSSRGYIGHMGSYRGTAKLSLIVEYHKREIIGDGVPPVEDGGYI